MKGETVRVIEISNLEHSAKELVKIGVNYNSAAKLSEGFISRVLKISGIDVREINIIRAEALRVGMSSVVSDDTLLLTAAKGELLICGTLMQYEMLIRNLGGAILNCPEIAIKIKKSLYNYGEDNFERVIRGKTFNFGEKSYVMGILNITEDSFSDGGRYINPEKAIERALKMVEDGADILDIGAESTRPGAQPVSEEEEIERILPVVEKISKIVNVPISIDTYKAAVAKSALNAGADIINDITGLKGDGAMAEVIADSDAYAVIMHMQGTPQTMQLNPVYQEVISDICGDLKESLAIAEIAGIKHEKIIIDPGIGFGKTTQHNLEIIERLSEFKVMGCPILMGASRKSLIGNVLKLPVEERVEGSLAIAAVSAMKGASIIRVHDIKETKRVLAMVDAIKNSIKE
jgi:dihydropteroate synthase